MTLIPPTISQPGAVIIDATVAVAISAKEAGREQRAVAEMSRYSANGCQFYAPGVLASETLYVLCGKQQSGALTAAEYAQAITNLENFMRGIRPPPSGEAALIGRAVAIRSGYGCSRSADSIYLALAEELAQTRITYLLTLDTGIPNQAARNAPTVNVHLL
ncbi:MAG: hypothetical protein M3Y28_10230 [Armatimonadota bacterium]|nr:hypothetical protein [Armatimonadota bacterium]